jgi:hypothetical protein
MVLAERARALAEFHTMVRRDEIPSEDKTAKLARSDKLRNNPKEDREAKGTAIHEFRSADLLPPIDWT